MELERYDLTPEEMVCVSLYLKTTPLNKAKAARDAGLDPSVFNKKAMKEAVAEQLKLRAERLRLGGDWVLHQLKRVYDMCIEADDRLNAIKALTQIGKHVDVRAFEPKQTNSDLDDAMVARLREGRQRAHAANLALRSQLPVDNDNEEVPPVSFFLGSGQLEQEPDKQQLLEQLVDTGVEAECITEQSEEEFDCVADADERGRNLLCSLSEKDKLEIWMERWRTGKPLGEM